MTVFDDVFDGLDNPAPDGVSVADDKNLKGRLPLRSDLVVDSNKYIGRRVSRDEAEIALVDDEQEVSGVNVENEAAEDADMWDAGPEEGGGKDVMGGSGLGEEVAEKEAEILRQEEAISARLANEKARETKRADAVKHQKAIHDSIVDVRIRLEQVLNVARGFPSGDDRNDVEDWQPFSKDTEQSGEMKETLLSLAKVSESLNESFQSCCPESVSGASNTSFTQWRDSVMDKWGRKVNEAEGVGPKGGFKAIDASISAQLRATLSTGKHIHKSRKVRTVIPLHGDAGEIAVGENELHFDDRELYRSLLQEIIESGDGEGGGLRYAQLAKSGKVKKKIDRSGSKARKLRYVVHDKLVGFLAPVPLADPGPIDEIIAGMFSVVKSERK